MTGIIRRSRRELDILREAGRIVAKVLGLMGEMVAPGVTTAELNEAALALIKENNGIPTFLGYTPLGMTPYPGCICASIDEEVVHGIPGPRKLKVGEIISIDVGVTYKGYVGDAARTFPVGNVSEEKQKLLDATRESLEAVQKMMKPGICVRDISWCVQNSVEPNGFSLVRDYTGHGVGHEMHLPPQVPNFVGSRHALQTVPLESGVVLAVEPMVNLGTHKTKTLKDGWTVVTADGKPSAHFENSIAIVDGGCEILTRI